MVDSKARSLTKTLVWRSWCIVSGLVILLLFGQDLWTATLYSVTVNVFLTISYYYHERLWSKIKWGRE